MGIFDVFKSKPDVREIGNLNCVNIGGKFDTGYKVDNKALFKFLKDHIKKNTLKKEFSSKINEKIISDTVNELKVGSAGIFFVPSNFINHKDYEKIMGFKIVDKTSYTKNKFYRAAADAARRAVLDSSPLPLPKGKEKLFKNIEFVFSTTWINNY